MNLKWIARTAVILAALAAAALPAHAQFGFTATGLAHTENVKLKTTYSSVGLYPIAPFQTAGTLSGVSSGTTTNFGGLISLDVGFRGKNGRKSTEVGGWYWSKGNGDVYQYDIRQYVAPSFAVQAARLGSTSAGGHAYSVFGIYEFDSKSVLPDAPHAFGFQIAPGMYIDPSGGKTTTSFSMYAQASYECARNVSLSVTDWYIRDRAVDLTRFALGVGYAF